MTTSDRRNQQEGFSLIELLIGTIAVITALGAVISACLQVSNVRKADEGLNLAYIAAMSELEDLRTIPFATLPTLDGVGFDVPALNGTPGGLTTVPGDADGLAGLFSITVEKSGGGTTLYRAVATVEWMDSGGRHNFTMETLMGERDYK